LNLNAAWLAGRFTQQHHRAARCNVCEFVVITLVAACLSLSGVLARATTLSPVPTAQELTKQIDHGRRTYVSMCARCHGLNLVSNGLGTDLRQFPQEGRERFANSVNKGIRAMPAWESILKPGDLDAIWLYMGSTNGWGALPAK
jgi:mono/diheme cytochrome c family protein